MKRCGYLAVAVGLALCAACIPREAKVDPFASKKEKETVTAGQPAGNGPTNPAPAPSPAIEPTFTKPAPEVASKTEAVNHIQIAAGYLLALQPLLRTQRPMSPADIVKWVETEMVKQHGKNALISPITNAPYTFDAQEMLKEGYLGVCAESKPEPDGTRLVVITTGVKDGKAQLKVVGMEEAKKYFSTDIKPKIEKIQSDAKFHQPALDTPEGQSVNYVKDLAQALARYANDNGGKFPVAKDSMAIKEQMLKYRPVMPDKYWVSPVTGAPYAFNQELLKLGLAGLQKYQGPPAAIIYDSKPMKDGSRVALTTVGGPWRLRAEEFAKLKK